MTEKIEPALSAEEWAIFLAVIDGYVDAAKERPKNAIVSLFDTPATAIAKNNALLPEDDPRKITREWIKDLRRIAESHPEHGTFAELIAIADALESFLPPETTT